MLLFVIALFYGYWFFKSAHTRGDRQPVLWAAAGFGGFFIPAFVSLVGLRLMLDGAVTASYSSAFLVSLFVGLVMLSAAIAVGNGFAFMLWRIFLSPPSSALSLWGQMRERRSLALPGRFPAGFASIYAMVCVLGLMLLMISQPFFYRIAQISLDVGPLFFTHFLAIVLHTAGLSVLFWKVSETSGDWRAVAAGWGLLTALIAFLNQLISLLALPIPLPMIVLMSTFAAQFASGFAVTAIVLFCVRRRGAGFITLAGSFILARFVLGFLLALPPLFMLPDAKMFVYELAMNLLWTVIVGLALYLAFAFQGNSRKA